MKCTVARLGVSFWLDYSSWSVMASTSATILTSLPSSSNVGRRCGDSGRVLPSLGQFGTTNRSPFSDQCESMSPQFLWRINGLLLGSGGFCERRKTMCCGQDFRARVYTECADSRYCSMGQRSLTCNPSFKVLRKSREAAIARASFNVAYEFEDAFTFLSLPLPPEPVLFPRKILNLKFAVLLMRSAYEAVDALDFIPMDKFQIKVS